MSDSAPLFMRARHDAWVENQAKRLGVEPAAILQSVRDFGFTAQDLEAAEDASALTRYPGRNGFPSFKVLGFVPLALGDRQAVKKVDSQSARHEFTVRKANNPKAKKVSECCGRNRNAAICGIRKNHRIGRF